LEHSEIEAHRASKTEVGKGLRTYVLTFLLLTAVPWCAFGIGGDMLHDSSAFADFTDIAARVAHFGEADMLTRTDFNVFFPYPLPSIYAFLFFIRLFPNPLAAYLTFALLSFFVAAGCLSWRIMRIAPEWLPQVAIWSTLLLGYPLIFLISRGNIEAVMWVLVLLGIVAFTRNRMLISAILWALAASMKIVPGLLCLLFLARRKYRIFAIAVALTVAFSVLGLAGVGPTISQAFSDSSKSAPYLRDTFILARVAPHFDESLFAATKQVICVYDYLYRNDGQLHKSDGRHPPVIWPGIKTALRIYDILIPIGALLLWWFRLRRLPLLNQFIAYIVLGILLPQVSYEYKLVYMYLVWGAFLLFLLADVATGRVKVPAAAIHTVLFSCAVIFVPLTYLAWRNKQGHPFGIGGQIKMSFLLLILLTVLRVPMPSSLFRDLKTLPSDSPAQPASN
jgi:glycosyl transferase family 87